MSALIFSKWKNERLEELYVPDVYQHNIYNIDYDILKDNGIKMISFDIDETIQSIFSGKVPKMAIPLFEILKKDFCVVLISNNNQDRINHFAKTLDVHAIEKDDSTAKKPSAKQFKAAKAYYKEKYGEDIEFSQMAHVGDSLCNDIAGAKALGIIACLIRKVGKRPISSTNKQLNKVLEERGLWHKHHKKEENDQYYQLGEKQDN